MCIVCKCYYSASCDDTIIIIENFIMNHVLYAIIFNLKTTEGFYVMSMKMVFVFR